MLVNCPPALVLIPCLVSSSSHDMQQTCETPSNKSTHSGGPKLTTSILSFRNFHFPCGFGMRLSALLSLLPLTAAHPGAPHLVPTLHLARSEVSDQGGWHDVAGAFTHLRQHHVFQGTGWNQAVSADLVHWDIAQTAPEAIHETYGECLLTPPHARAS